MAKANGCTGCQDVSKKKTAPAFWVVAAEWKKGDVDTAVGGRPRPGLRS
jgi:cytochrome c551/c552